MKQKFFSFMLVAILCFCTSTNAFASEMNASSSTTTVSYTKGANYIVSIPAEIHFSGTHSFKVKATQMDLIKDQKLYVSTTNTEIELTNEFGDTGLLWIESDYRNSHNTTGTDLAYFEPRQLESDQTITLRAGDPTFAGTYTGTITFNFRLE